MVIAKRTVLSGLLMKFCMTKRAAPFMEAKTLQGQQAN